MSSFNNEIYSAISGVFEDFYNKGQPKTKEDLMEAIQFMEDHGFFEKEEGGEGFIVYQEMSDGQNGYITPDFELGAREDAEIFETEDEAMDCLKDCAGWAIENEEACVLEIIDVETDETIYSKEFRG